MANSQHFFFYAPTWDYPPSGPIQLGNVITSVKKPHRPLYRVPPEGPDVFSTEKNSVQYTKEKLRSGKFSILTKFLSVLGFGTDAGLESGKSIEESFSFTTMETTQFSPKLPYLQKCIESEDVRRFLHVSRYCKPVYIITGLKIVTGARADTLRTRTVKTNLAVEVDGTVWSGGAVPVGGGPGLEGEVSSKATTEWSGGDDFVFAFRVTKVTVAKATGQVRSEEEYRKGAMLGNEEGHVEGPRLSVLISEDFDVEAEDFDTEELMEDREQVVFMTPRGREEV